MLIDIDIDIDIVNGEEDMHNIVETGYDESLKSLAWTDGKILFCMSIFYPHPLSIM